VTKPSSEDVTDKWAGKYIKNPVKDAWNHDLIYVEPGQYNTDSFDLSSAGHDGVPGNEDDITNWQKS
jgi:general secretion pathway protein G